MTEREAVNILKPAESTKSALKQAYREACKKYHPDIVGDIGLEMMKSINLAYATLINLESWSCDAGTDEDTLSVIMAVWNKINTLQGITGELCGTWLWVSGDTRQHKAALKAVGCRWASKKMMWYWRPEGYRKKSKKVLGIDQIRTMFGTETLDTVRVAQII